jgi:hypothetical protein
MILLYLNEPSIYLKTSLSIGIEAPGKRQANSELRIFLIQYFYIKMYEYWSPDIFSDCVFWSLHSGYIDKC